MTTQIPTRSFYASSNFIPPALAPGKGRQAALKAIRNDPRNETRTFYTQQAAIDHCESHRGNGLCLWSFEIDNRGRRRYTAASFHGFWRFYSRLLRRGGLPHYYEVVRLRHACKLYFDLEFQLPVNSDAKAEHMVQAVVDASAELAGISVSRTGMSLVELDSSTNVKFSRHIIFQNIAFCENVQAGQFARRVVELIATRNASLVMVNKEDNEKVPFVDLGVYTMHRCFRIVGSSKFGKTKVLLPIGQSDDNVCISKEVFMRSLLGTVDSDVSLRGSPSPLPTVTKRCIGAGNARNTDIFVRTGSSSPFPEVDAYVNCIVADHGGGIHGITLLSGGDSIIYAIKGGYKYCANIGRHHKSNNVLLIADMRTRSMYQRCFDPDCRGFRSESWPMPASIFATANDEQTANDLSDARPSTDLDGGVSDEVLNEAMDAFLAARATEEKIVS